MWIVSIEGSGDGSGNLEGWNRPGLSLFSNKSKAAEGIKFYLETYCKNQLGIDIDIPLSRATIICDNDGIVINEFCQLRVEEIKTNPKSLQKGHWCYWDLKNKLKLNNFIKELNSDTDVSD